MLAGCTSAPSTSPNVEIATAPTRAPRPTATPITILSNEVAPPPLIQMTDESKTTTRGLNRSIERKNMIWRDFVPLTQRGSLPADEFRYINHIVRIASIWDIETTKTPTFKRGMTTDQFEIAAKKIYRVHKAYGKPPASYANINGRLDNCLKLLLRAVETSRKIKALGNDERNFKQLKRLMNQWSVEFKAVDELNLTLLEVKRIRDQYP